MKLKAKIINRGTVFGHDDYLTEGMLDACVKNAKDISLYLDGGERFLKIGKCQFKRRSNSVYVEAEIDKRNEEATRILLDQFKLVAIYPMMFIGYKPIQNFVAAEKEIDHVAINCCILTYSDCDDELKPNKVKLINEEK